MTSTPSPSHALSFSAVVPASPAESFAAFTRDMTAWWPPEHHIGATPLARAVVEPVVGGRWFEEDAAGQAVSWGKVLAWEPGKRLVLTWQIDAQWQFDPSLVTEVEVRFLPAEGGATRVELVHGNLDRYGEAAPMVTEALGSPQGWPMSFARFAEHLRQRKAA